MREFTRPAWAERKIEFYEHLANREYWRQPCGNCNCPRWSHAREGSSGIILVACGCGRCSNFTADALDALEQLEAKQK